MERTFTGCLYIALVIIQFILETDLPNGTFFLVIQKLILGIFLRSQVLHLYYYFFFWSHLYFKNSLTLKMDQFPPWFKILPPCPSLYLLISSDLMLTLILSRQCFLALSSLEVLKFFYVMFREMLVHVTINSKTTVTSNKIIFLTLPS